MDLPVNVPVVIVARHSGLTLDVRDAGGEMALVQTAGLGGRSNREFIVQPFEDGYYKIWARHNGLALDVRDAGGQLSVVQTAGYGRAPNRDWSFADAGGGFWTIVARHSGLGLDVRDAGGEMSLVQTAGRGGQPNREFAIIPVAEYQGKGRFAQVYCLLTTTMSPQEIEAACVNCVRSAGLGAIGGWVGGPRGAAIGAALGALAERECDVCAKGLGESVKQRLDRFFHDHADGGRAGAGPDIVKPDGSLDLPHSNPDKPIA